MALPGYDGICATPHGYDFCLTVTCAKDVTRAEPWVVDLTDLESVVQREVLDVLDDTYLNDAIAYPSLEGLVYWIADRIFDQIPEAAHIELRAGERYGVQLDRTEWTQEQGA